MVFLTLTVILLDYSRRAHLSRSLRRRHLPDQRPSTSTGCSRVTLNRRTSVHIECEWRAYSQKACLGFEGVLDQWSIVMIG